MKSSVVTTADFDHSPFLVFYEITRACDQVCHHCRACAQPRRHPNELTHEQSKAMIDQLTTFAHLPLLVFTGGDPLKRPDVFDLVNYARRVGLNTAMTPSATPLVTVDAINRLRDAGLGRLAVSLDAADAETHDAFRGTSGSFDRTLQIMETARKLDVPMQVNTTISQRNVDQVDNMAELLADHGIVLWSVFFLIPVGRGRVEPRISPTQYEQVFEKLWRHAQTKPFGIKTTEAHHYRRFVLQRQGDPQRDPLRHRGQRVQRAPLGVNDGRGVMFVSHVGQIFPSGFMPIDCGRFPRDSIVDVYQNHPLFRTLRNPNLLKGKCGRCEFRSICGGSRARAYAVSRDPMAQEPDCMYQPQAAKEVAIC